MLAELTFAFRRLRADGSPSAAAILVVALGAGLNVAVFCIAYGLLARPPRLRQRRPVPGFTPPAA